MRRLVPVLLTAACALLAAAPIASAGLTPQPRIVGGHDAAAGRWPSLVALEDRTRPLFPPDPADYDQQICGGTLVTPEWVLTAGHCVTDEGNVNRIEPATRFAITYGSQALDGTGTRIAVAEVHRNPAYAVMPVRNDVALLKLAAPVPNASVLPVAGAPASALWNTAGGTAQIAGWGSEDAYDPDDEDPPVSYPVDLQEATVPLVSDADCGDVYTGFVASVMLCAGDVARGGVDTCQGDSGGPLTVVDGQGHQVLAGDTSFGNGCAWPGNPGVYAEIAGMRSFIDQTIGWTESTTTSVSSLTFTGPGDAARTVTLTSTGTAPVSIMGAGTSSVAPSDGAGAYVLTNDTCVAIVLTQGQSCSVDVRAIRTGADPANLVFQDDHAAGGTTVPLGIVAPAPAPVATTPAVVPATPVQRPRPVARLPKVTLAALSGHRVKVTSSGAGTVRLTFSRTVRHGRRRVRQTLATATVKFTNKGTKTITLTLTAAGRSALRHGRRVRATWASGGRTGSLTLR
jgi:secreted trypsin-like serine protease